MGTKVRSTFTTQRVITAVGLLLLQAVTYVISLTFLIGMMSWSGPDATGAIRITGAIIVLILVLSVVQVVLVLRRRNLPSVRRASMLLAGLTLASAALIGISGTIQRHPATPALVTLGVLLAMPPAFVLVAVPRHRAHWLP